jgi:hypothetical protein
MFHRSRFAQVAFAITAMTFTVLAGDTHHQSPLSSYQIERIINFDHKNEAKLWLKNTTSGKHVEKTTN